MKNSKEMITQYINIADKKMQTPLFDMMSSGIFAGMFIAFGAFASQVASSITNKVVGALFFPIGLTLVVCVGVELFTGDNLLMIKILSERKLTKSTPKILMSLLFVYIGNFIGSFWLALMVTLSGLPNSMGLIDSMINTATAKVSLTISEMIIRGILCNILVCLAVWLALKAEGQCGKTIGLYLPTALFVLCGFEHSVANMYFIPVGIMVGADISLISMFTNILFVTIGNMIGGMIIVSIGLWTLFKE